MNLAALKEPIPGVDQGNQLIADLDECLLLGFARLGPAQHAALDTLIGAFGGTPLATVLREASDAVKRSEFVSNHFCALAAARAAIQGAQYDALLQRASEALGRLVPASDDINFASVSAEGQQTALLSSAQQWLMELALAGFKNLSLETLSPFMATLEQLQAEPRLTRLASLLTGFLSELLANTPSGSIDIPVFRWADLWTRAMVMAQQLPAAETGATVSGTLYPLGADVRAHAFFASVVVYGLLESGRERRVVRVPLSSYKVDVIAQMELWQLFRPVAEELLEAIASKRSLEIAGIQLLASGDLFWNGKAKIGDEFDPVAIAKLAALSETRAVLPEAPLARHPVQLAELVCFESCTIQASSEAAALGRTNGDGAQLELVVEGQSLPLAAERLVKGSELDSKTLASANALVGLLRFDRGGWAVQPLSIRGKAGKKEFIVMSGSKALEFCKKDKSKTLATLSERASKLLRQ